MDSVRIKAGAEATEATTGIEEGRVRAFGWVFIVVGGSLAGISAKAISDPQSPIGWSRWSEDPWSQGLLIGVSIVAIGIGLLQASERLTSHARLNATQVIAMSVAGAVGFLLFAPFGVTSACSDGPASGGCRNQSWSTVTGLTFDGHPGPLLGLTVALISVVITASIFKAARGRL